jgi:glycosyltransferase involved in cell wall biosynthesis
LIKNRLIIGIDASNISSGGGLTHLVELLRAADPVSCGFRKVIVWAPDGTLESIEDRHWLEKRSFPALNSNWIVRGFWQFLILGRLAVEERVDLLFVPGGALMTRFQPIVTMNRNLLPFEWRESLRFGFSFFPIKCFLLRLVQTAALRRANGVIFLTNYAKDLVLEITGRLRGRIAVVSHGIDVRFFQTPRQQRDVADANNDQPFRIVYVSKIDPYKHQWNVVEAVAKLREMGVAATLLLVGPAYPPALKRLNRIIDKVDPKRNWVSCSGAISHKNLHKLYADVDIALFASSCETFGQILTEYMAAGLPIACSKMSAMPELLQDGGVYFDPLDPCDIAATLNNFIGSSALRTYKSTRAFELAHLLSWHDCAVKTFNFLSEVALDRVARH